MLRSRGASGSDGKISASKIQPLDSEQKEDIPHDQSSRGVAGTDRSIDQTRIDPLGGAGQNKTTAPHADSQGVVGRDETVESAKIDPLSGDQQTSERKNTGLDDEAVDAARAAPLGSVREQVT